MSCFIFANCVYVSIQKQNIEATGDNLWYRKAQKFRAERNFWLSLFNVSLWLIVYEVYCLKKLVVKLKKEASDAVLKLKELEDTISESVKEEVSKKEDWSDEHTF